MFNEKVLHRNWLEDSTSSHSKFSLVLLYFHLPKTDHKTVIYGKFCMLLTPTANYSLACQKKKSTQVHLIKISSAKKVNIKRKKVAITLSSQGSISLSICIRYCVV
jgi:hypothetical protein